MKSKKKWRNTKARKANRRAKTEGNSFVRAVKSRTIDRKFQKKTEKTAKSL